MDSRQTKKRRCSAMQPTDKNAKRREIYGNIAIAEKEALLLQRRLQGRSTTTEHLVLAAATTTTSNSTVVHKGKDVLHPTCVSKKATALSGVSRRSPAVHKEEIMANRFYNFEKGSTSASTANPQPKASDAVPTVGSSSSAEPCTAAIEVMLERKGMMLQIVQQSYFVHIEEQQHSMGDTNGCSATIFRTIQRRS